MKDKLFRYILFLFITIEVIMEPSAQCKQYFPGAYSGQTEVKDLLTLGYSLSDKMIAASATDDAGFLKEAREAYPEVLRYEGKVFTSPETPAGDAKAEQDRTERAFVAFKWLMEGNYAEFTKGQLAPVLTFESFTELSVHFKRKYGNAKECDAMNATMAIHDLGKILAFQDMIRETSQKPHLVNHDEILLEALDLVRNGHLPADTLPSYSRLDPADQDSIYQEWKMGLNKGQLIQGENVPANLTGLLRARAKNPEAVLHFFDHERLDMMSIMAVKPGCFLYNQELCTADNLAIKTLLDERLTTEKEVYKAYLNERAKLVGFEVNDEKTYAAARMCATCRFYTQDKAAPVLRYFSAQPANSSLTKELCVSGLDGKKALLIYYSPAVVANTLNNKNFAEVSLEKKLEVAFQLLEKIYAKGREVVRDQDQNGIAEINVFAIANAMSTASDIYEISTKDIFIDPNTYIARLG
jgi:hypothetical protein